MSAARRPPEGARAAARRREGTPARFWRQFVMFGLAGGLGLVIDLAVLYLAAPLLGWYAGRLLSFWAAASATWWLNRRLTFAVPANAPGASAGAQYLRYLALMLVGGAVNYLVYVAVLGWVQAPWGAAAGVALGSLAGMVVNFLSARHLVFGRPRADKAGVAPARRDNRPP
ncbi:GtrA family protein [Ottowia sp.]|uniref:GtrA family protein n=1 Tax=Ottowia sp. TaxID=1898956 RepID=UPI0039E6E2AB